MRVADKTTGSRAVIRENAEAVVQRIDKTNCIVMDGDDSRLVKRKHGGAQTGCPDRKEKGETYGKG